MPFVDIDTPSIQIGLLKSIAASAGFPVTNYHFSLDFARWIGTCRYSALAQHRGALVGDWLFSAAAFGSRVPRLNHRFLDDFGPELTALLQPVHPEPVEWLWQLHRREVPAFVDHLLDSVPWGRYRVVGFTSCFQQNVASFALANRIKERHEDVCIVFGGANFDGEMGRELVRDIGCIDYAIAGEADETFVQFLSCIADQEDPVAVPGVISRRNGGIVGGAPASLIRELDPLPTPDYSDFFARAEHLGLVSTSSRDQIRIPFESSRGCWWGQKHHCTFCGLNGAGMSFRAKTPARVFQELNELAVRHRTFQFDAVDNILSMNHLDEVLPRLVDEQVTYTLFYETKSNLRREQIRTLRRAGVRTIQPGIESLSSRVLSLMRKGVSASQNVNLLRWARYYGIRVIWNLLWGFPGEAEEDYQQQAELMPRLVHLQPPLSSSRIWMERFSPIYFDREHFPVRRLKAERSYSYVYPESIDLDQIAYFFDYEFESALPEEAYQGVSIASRLWRQAWQRAEPPRFTFRFSPGLIRVHDGRACPATGYTLTGPLATIYAMCSEAPRAIGSIAEQVASSWSTPRVESALNELSASGLMMRDGDRYLSLALPDDQASL